MANATGIVGKRTIRRQNEFIKRSTETLSAETTFYTNALIGTDATGYLCKGDDTQAWLMTGVVRGDNGNPVLPAGTAGAATLLLDVHQPFRMELAITSIAVTDLFKPVYALFDNQGTLDPAATTYANLIGHVVDIVASGIALVEPAYDGVFGNKRLGAAKFLAATGTQTLSKCDVNKTINCPNTAAHTVNLPPIADCPPGSRLWFVKSTSDAQAVTLDANASEEIDGATTLATIDAIYDTAELVSNGVRWIVQNRDIT